jgi:iron complex transport system substrate-binding protein
VTARPRIASLCPSNTEILCAMGLGDCLVGVDLYSDYPPDVVHAVPKLGPDLDIDIERLRDLHPDLTVCSLSVPGMERVVEAVRNAGLPHVVLSPHTLEDIWQDMRAVADALDGVVPQVELETVITALQRRVENIATQTKDCPYRPRLYWEWWPNPVFSPAQSNWLTEISFLAGCVNIFADLEGDQVKDDGQRVVAANPDYILAVWTGVPQHKVPLQKIVSRKSWASVPAMRNRRIFILSEGLYCRPSPRLIDGLEQLVGIVHPDIARSLQLPSPASYGPVRTWDGSWLEGVAPSKISQ